MLQSLTVRMVMGVGAWDNSLVMKADPYEKTQTRN
jgi:hypothetical protein